MATKIPTPRALLFDFDGTLVNTTPLILHSFHETWQRVFGFSFADEVYIQTFGMLLPRALRDLAERSIAEGRIDAPGDRAPFLDARADELLRTYRAINLDRHDEMIEPFPGIDEALDELRALDIPFGIVSSKLRAGVERGLRIFGLEARFELIVSAEDVTNHKPHPEPLLQAAERLGLPPEDALYIGDSTHDMVAGRAAGMPTAAAAWGPFPRADLERVGPDYLVAAPGDLPALFQRQEGKTI